MLNLYLTYLILVDNKKSGLHLSRISSQIIQLTLFWELQKVTHWVNIKQIVYFDGLCQINEMVLISEIYLLGLAFMMMLILGKVGEIQSEIYQIFMTNLIGLSFQLNSHDLIVTVISWEVLNLSQYLLVTMQIHNQGASQAAGLKYFQQSAQTTAFQLMGITLIYGMTGSTQMDIQKTQFTYLFNDSSSKFSTQFPFLQILMTLTFKLGAAPFHQWAPDLYDAIPTSITMWISILPKLALLILAGTQFSFLLEPLMEKNLLIFTGLSSLIIGSISLGSQFKMKRFLAYSSISHLGLLLLILGSTTNSLDSYFYYIFIYGLTAFLIFMILLTIQSNILNTKEDLHFIKQLSGLFQLNPALTYSLIISLFSLAGIPPLAGFFAKLQILQSLLSESSIYLSLIVILASAISTANYLSVIKISYLDHPLYPIYFSVPPLMSSLISICSLFLLLFFQKPHFLLSILSNLLLITSL